MKFRASGICSPPLSGQYGPHEQGFAEIAVDATGMLGSAFPYDPPFSVAQALDSRFLPGEPFAPSDVIRD